MWRLARALLAVLVGVVVGGVVTAPAASAAPDRPEALLGELWETVLETPVPENPLAAGEPWCVDLDGVVAPFTLDPAAPPTCTVRPGTKVLVAAVTIECSTVEPPPFSGSTEAELRACARAVDVPGQTLTVTVDGRPVPLSLVETPLLTLDLPAENILGVAPQQALSVAAGYVALLHPLPPGTHEIVITGTGTFFGDFVTVTTVVVQPGRP
ncbi:hypothetical protein SAMN05660690_2186 [Geodermatophilus telluris]|uniref:Uncharacterized protein n=1 Tax=Geodermatophilus telluris TaxID=1190417 RepID=A0A1G6NQP9_9ACTN|nr:hypothetical protein [Geodermatophilus telluris]SDC70079.1 hypothetical protein SAMN05660690_2186 [Geodermatophilus telluris]